MEATIPRNSSGTYSKPAGTAASPNTTITSSQFNATIDDIAADLNAPRPVSAGGTGAATVPLARTALGVAQAQSNNTDATAGRGLIVGGFGLGTTGIALVATDLNNVVTGVFWSVPSITGMSNLPVNRPGVLTVTRRADGNVAQTYQVIQSGQDPFVYARVQAGGTWTPWQLLLGVVETGTISLGARGAILYDRYSDGTQTAYGFIADLNIGTPTAFQSQWRSLTQTVTWDPLTWSADPRVVVGVRAGSAPGVIVMSETPLEFTYAYVSTSSALAPTDRSITFQAVGRWR